ncbi:MAG TPA: DUF1206 domain-containing protein [Thermoleophilaceae bacterium]|nr:DUF1206 domain-containing protein [Thermoleophilaceae bacterium]
MASLGAARQETRQLEQVQPFQWLVRAGFVARAITYGVIGALAFALAAGAGTDGTAPNQQGALALIARNAAGRAALVAICAGLLAYALWKLTQGILGTGPEGGGSMKPIDRVGNFAGGVVYLGFFGVALRVLTGSSGNSSAQQKHAAAGVLGWPGGQEIVAIGGVVLIAVSLYQLYDALSRGFTDEAKTQQMNQSERRLFITLGCIGLTARALVFALVGYFFVRTAISFNPNDAVGLDGALAKLHHQVLGPWVLGFAAAGLVVFAAYSLLEARFRRL